MNHESIVTEKSRLFGPEFTESPVINILKVPATLPAVKGDTRYSHFVPLVMINDTEADKSRYDIR